LKEGNEVEIIFHAEEEKALMAELPQHVTLEITWTEPGVKGDTATNTMKPATLETGAEVRVPLFMNEGEKIRINTTDGSYMDRVKE
jgi:elongation factor P